MPGKIYLVSLNGVPKYVGFTTKTVEDRWKRHCKDSTSKKKRFNRPLLHAIQKYGANAFEIKEIYSGEDKNHTLNIMEETLIREHKTHVSQGGYNVCYGGQGGGRQQTEETKKKIAAGHKGKKKPKRSLETIEKTRQAVKLYWQTHPPKKISEESKEKMRQSALKRWGKVV